MKYVLLFVNCRHLSVVILEGFCVAVNGEKFWAKNQRHYKRYVIIPDVVIIIISKVYCRPTQ